MGFKDGTINHAKGFILNKLWQDRRIGAKHIQVAILKHGYPSKWSDLIDKALHCLRAEGCIQIVPKRTGRNSTDHVSLVHARLTSVRALINGYRRTARLAPLRRDFQEQLA